MEQYHQYQKECRTLTKTGDFNNQFKSEATINLIKELDAEIEKHTSHEDIVVMDIAPGEEIMVTFDQLLEMVAKAVPNCRIRFCSSHPKDITDEVLYTMAKYENICNYIHYPLQSGSSRVLELMNRTYKC